MASGRAHDRATLIVSAPIGMAAAVLWGADAGLIAAAACLIGGLWLSPDLDTHSNAPVSYTHLTLPTTPYV